MSRGQTGPGEGSSSFSDVDFSTDEVTGINAYTFADRVKERISEIGLGGIDRPVLTDDHKGLFPGLHPGDYFNGRLPVVIRRLSLDQLSALYTMFTSWYRYLVFHTNIVGVERSEAKRQKEFIWSHLRKQYKKDPINKKPNSDQVASDLARCDWRFVNIDAQYEELNVLYNCLNAQLEVTEQDMATISREVTIVQTKLSKEALGTGFNRRMEQARWSQRNAASDSEEEVPGKPRRLKITRGSQ